ncbi:MAG: Fe-S cluster assembly protein SufB [Candidatus Nanohaloarchaea archaeon]
MSDENVEKNWERFDHKNEERAAFKADRGLTEETIKQISEQKDEPEWMKKRRLKAFRHFEKKPMPDWGPDLSELDFDEITPFLKPDAEQSNDWEDVPDDIRETFDRLGIPEAEREALSGVGAQYESEVVYQNMKEEWEKKGVIFCDMDKAVQEHPGLVKEYFMTKNVPPQDNKFAALHGAVWSGGSFVYVPEGVEVEIPVQAYFRMNSQGMGQFEHTLIIAEKDAKVHYIEGCSAPQYTRNNLHSGLVEVFVGEDAHVQYSTVQNWSKNTYNLNTKRAKVEKNGTMEWVSGSMGSRVTMLYPSSHLNGEGARANHISIAYAGDGQNIDTGAKIVHNAPNTKSTIESKSISQGDGRTNYRGLVRVSKGAENSKSSIECDALMFDKEATSDTEPYIEIKEDDVELAHEATVGKIGDEEIHYMMSRGIEEEEAKEMIVRGFIEPIAKELPLEYAVELNRLIQLEMEGSLG